MNRNHRRGFKAVIVLLMIMTVFENSNPKAQSLQKTFEELWINIPSCPLEFRMNSSRRYSMLENRSSATVIRYRLGCVTGTETNRPRVVRKAPPVNTDLESGKGLGASINVHTSEMERCSEMKAQLAVIEVLFKDGFVWKAR